jgi:hypothetical protein
MLDDQARLSKQTCRAPGISASPVAVVGFSLRSAYARSTNSHRASTLASNQCRNYSLADDSVTSPPFASLSNLQGSSISLVDTFEPSRAHTREASIPFSLAVGDSAAREAPGAAGASAAAAAPASAGSGLSATAGLGIPEARADQVGSWAGVPSCACSATRLLSRGHHRSVSDWTQRECPEQSPETESPPQLCCVLF